MKAAFEQTLIAVWRQALVDETAVVKLGAERYHPNDFTRGWRPQLSAVTAHRLSGAAQVPATVGVSRA